MGSIEIFHELTREFRVPTVAVDNCATGGDHVEDAKAERPEAASVQGLALPFSTVQPVLMHPLAKRAPLCCPS